MRRSKLSAMTVEQLVDLFAEIAIAQDQALLYDEVSKFNRLFDRMKDVDDELRMRGRYAQLSLIRLYEHPNMQVRLQAAKWSIGVAPEKARAVIERVAKSAWFPQAGEASMTLWNLDTGVFKPD